MKIVTKILIVFLTLSVASGVFAQDGWILRNSGTTTRLNSISSYDGQNVVAVGENGVVVISDNAALTCGQTTIHEKSLFGVVAIDGKIFCAVGDKDSVFRTTNSGQTWIGVKSHAKGDCSNFIGDFPIVAMRAITYDSIKEYCVAVGGGGETIFSGDSGKHWVENLPMSNSDDLYCVSSQDGFVLSGSCGLNPGYVFTTSDAGDSWRTDWIKSGNLFGSDAQARILVGSGGTIFHTPNKALSWDLIPSPTKFNLNATHFGNIVRGYAVGDHGTILMTTDGGYTWVQQHSPTTQNLRSVHMSDPFHGFICGDSGVILTTQNGGYFDTVNYVDPSPQSGSGIRNYPNPFASRTAIEISIPHPGHLRLSIYNMLGEEVAILANGSFETGVQIFEWNAGDAPSGIYLCKWDMDGRIISSQITLEK